MIRFDSVPYTINDFAEWDKRKELILTPKFQRRDVWSDKARSYLMDTIIRGYPITKIFMRHDVDPKTRKSIREIVDGQQRTRTILLYINDGFKISKIHNEDYGGKFFSDLPEPVQREVLKYKITVDILSGAEEKNVLDMFSRLNTYTVVLNKQEQINAKYFGVFKQTVYLLGYEYYKNWVLNGILREHEITRMGEAEFASELVIQLIDGCQDKKSIDNYYKKYDDDLPHKAQIMSRFRLINDTILEILGDFLTISNFKYKLHYYTLFGVTNEIYSKINKSSHSKYRAAILSIDDVLNKGPEEVSKKEAAFYNASLKQVTDISRRKIRHEFVKNVILSYLGHV